MIIGIGTDICNITRIEGTLEKFGNRFLDRTFTEHERLYCEGRSVKAAYYAKRFAAKEAVAKALAKSDTGSLSWRDVEVRNDPSGRPRIVLYNGALDRFHTHIPDGYKGNIQISLSDDYPYAVAFAIIEASLK